MQYKITIDTQIQVLGSGGYSMCKPIKYLISGYKFVTSKKCPHSYQQFLLNGFSLEMMEGSARIINYAVSAGSDCYRLSLDHNLAHLRQNLRQEIKKRG